MNELSSARYIPKNDVNIPEDATIFDKSYEICVEEIENGYIIKKEYRVGYMYASGEKDYAYITKIWYSKSNPMKIKIKGEDELADKLN